MLAMDIGLYKAKQQKAEERKERAAKRIRAEKMRVRRAIGALDLHATVKRILQAFANQFFHDRSGVRGAVTKVLDAFADRLGLSVPTIRRALRKLEALGYIAKLSKGSGGRGVGTAYAVDFDAIEADAWPGQTPASPDFVEPQNPIIKPRKNPIIPVRLIEDSIQALPFTRAGHGDDVGFSASPPCGPDPWWQGLADQLPPSWLPDPFASFRGAGRFGAA